MKGIIGKKVGMTQIFTEEGVVIPVTVIEAGPAVVTQKKAVEKDGYKAIQVGFQAIKERRINKPLKGHFDKADVEYKKYLSEFKVDNLDDYQVGQEIKADVFAEGDKVDISGISKGKGTQGNIRRHGHHRGPETHGSKNHRLVGSLGASSHPSRVFKNTKMPGRMGHENVTVQNLEVVKIDAEKNLLLVKGAVPGPKGGLLKIKETVKVGK